MFLVQNAVEIVQYKIAGLV